jgi:uncharacterized membrane protein YcjF (UPF0283 family)
MPPRPRKAAAKPQQEPATEPRFAVHFGDVVKRESGRPADPLDEQHVKNIESDRELKRSYAKVFMWAMLVQVVVADVIFVVYAWAGKGWNVDPKVMIAWLSATVVQVVAVVAIITQGLFDREKRSTVRKAKEG